MQPLSYSTRHVVLRVTTNLSSPKNLSLPVFTELKTLLRWKGIPKREWNQLISLRWTGNWKVALWIPHSGNSCIDYYDRTENIREMEWNTKERVESADYTGLKTERLHCKSALRKLVYQLLCLIVPMLQGPIQSGVWASTHPVRSSDPLSTPKQNDTYSCLWELLDWTPVNHLWNFWALLQGWPHISKCQGMLPKSFILLRTRLLNNLYFPVSHGWWEGKNSSDICDPSYENVPKGWYLTLCFMGYWSWTRSENSSKVKFLIFT